MALATTMSTVQAILTAIQTLLQLQPMYSISNYKHELESLQNIVKTVKSVLEDADEAKQEALNSQEECYINELKDAIYEVDDIIDEFLTLAKRNQHTQAGDKVPDKVRSFLSRFNLVTQNVSKKIKLVNKKLESIASKSSLFRFKVTRFMKEHTSSLTCAEIIGRDDAEKTIGMLKPCYHQLEPPLRTCFAYCAIFPKDRKITKQMLIRLWMAQGYINEEDIGEEYFLELLNRVFFQDAYVDEFGEVARFKMHDLVHDLPEQVAGDEICILNSDTVNVGERVCHLSCMDDSYRQEIIDKTSIRQVTDYFAVGTDDHLLVGESMSRWTGLRSLDLSRLRVESSSALLESIGKLLHLRYLDLSSSQVMFLPKSITKLINLQTLDLSSCIWLQKLPDNITKLNNLSTLNVACCRQLTRMPSGIGKLTHLPTVGQYPVDSNNSDGLEDLQLLDHLKGNLTIKIRVHKNAKYVKAVEGTYLRRKERLRQAVIKFKTGPEYEKSLLEEMQPCDDLRELNLKGYHGDTIPRWPKKEDNSALFDLPNLVMLMVYKCAELVCLPSQVGKLPHLKVLRLYKLSKMEYLLNLEPASPPIGENENSSLFPNLNQLCISDLPNLVGWWPRIADISNHQESYLTWLSSPCFPQLRVFSLRHCPKMTYIPTSPYLKDLNVTDSRRALTWREMMCIPRHVPSLVPKPMIMEISNMEWLKLMPSEYFQSLIALRINGEDKLESFTEVRELTSLQFLEITGCPKLKGVSEWLENLSELNSLSTRNCQNLLLAEIPWEKLSSSLQCLNLRCFEEFEELPEGIRYCTSLRSLVIQGSSKLESLLQWIGKLISLRKLELRWISLQLKERCKQPNGEDWPLIEQIPLVCIQTEPNGEDETWVSNSDTDEDL